MTFYVIIGKAVREASIAMSNLATNPAFALAASRTMENLDPTGIHFS